MITFDKIRKFMLYITRSRIINDLPSISRFTHTSPYPEHNFLHSHSEHRVDLCIVCTIHSLSSPQQHQYCTWLNQLHPSRSYSHHRLSESHSWLQFLVVSEERNSNMCQFLVSANERNILSNRILQFYCWWWLQYARFHFNKFYKFRQYRTQFCKCLLLQSEQHHTHYHWKYNHRF